MDYDVKIKELEERIIVLESAENKRIRKKRIKIIFEVSKVVLVITLITIIYVNINNKIIKPYKEKIDFIEEKVNSVEKVVNDTIESIKKFIKF